MHQRIFLLDLNAADMWSRTLMICIGNYQVFSMGPVLMHQREIGIASFT